ncbi:DUF192 domain-containing protein [Sphingobium sp. AN558]|uniref:DUF192 domain-containing protein n=1 Tax=Sphingobium sp. AN558 TaxID=3133442 RepID=UPI0030BB53F1
MTRLLLAALLLGITACSSHPASADKADASAAATQIRLPLVIRNAKGNHRFDVEVARSPQEQERGLMFRTSIETDGGMLFPMSPPRTASFWMENTLVPLDMLFIRTDGSIAFIKANAEPYSRIPVSAGIPVAAVLELRGGRAAELGIAPEDRVRWGRCAAPAEKVADGLDFCPAP